MKKAQFLKILKKYREGKASEEEKSFLNAYYNLFEGQPDITTSLHAGEREFLKNRIKSGIGEQMFAAKPSASSRTINMVRRWSVAASLLIIASAATFIYLRQQTETSIIYKGAKANITPGGNKAVLMLANGSRIDINGAANGQIAQQGNTQIVKSASGGIIYKAGTSKSTDTVFNTVYTPSGGQVMIVLPDSSKVYLNAQSSLRFPTSFKGNYRNVQLTGEAYFEVAHNKYKPFHVISNGQVVEVLGTHFDVKAYADESITQTTLLEGRVAVTGKAQRNILLPGQQAENIAGDISVLKNIDAEEAIAWKSGLFHFEQADIKEIMREFSRWYDVQIIYDEQVKGRLFSGDIHKNLELEQALELLNYENVHFTISGRKIIITS